MKVLLLAIFVSFFALLPLYVLSNMVMPKLNGLDYSYSHEGQTVQSLFPGS